MRKYPLIITIALLVVLLYSQTFTAQQTADNNRNLQAGAPFNHDKIDSEKAKKMRDKYGERGRKEKHEFTKFNRQELIAVLQGMEGVDTVKFIMGAFLEEGAKHKKYDPVILLQVVENGKPIPGGAAQMYMYMEGAICPPPYGITCSLE